MGTTINLLRVLGVTDRKWISNSPAITLHEDGTITVWSAWKHSQEDPEALKSQRNQTRYYRWVNARNVFDLKSVRKVRYHEDVNIFICGNIDFSSVDGNLAFYRALHADTREYFTLDPLWLAVPEVQEFLTLHIPDGIRNDFDPARNWLLRRRILNLNYFTTKDRELENKSEVKSPNGSITWNHEDNTALVHVDGDGRARRQPSLEWLLHPGGELQPRHL